MVDRAFCRNAGRDRAGPDPPSAVRHVERVRAAQRLRRQVAGVRRGQVHARRHLLGHGHPEPRELRGLVRVVAEQRDRGSRRARSIWAATV